MVDIDYKSIKTTSKDLINYNISRSNSQESIAKLNTKKTDPKKKNTQSNKSSELKKTKSVEVISTVHSKTDKPSRTDLAEHEKIIFDQFFKQFSEKIDTLPSYVSKLCDQIEKSSNKVKYLIQNEI